jgi:hypothetical protein
VFRAARRDPSAVLLAAQLAGVLLYPFMEGAAGRALLSVFGILLLGLVLIAARGTAGFHAAGALIAYMLADHVITRDELFAVGATFTLVAWAFAYSFTVCQAIEPNSFSGAIDPEADRTWMELLFLSFTTLSSVGLTDIYPVEPFARSLIMLEQVAGVGYVAMVVSRLVGLMVLGRRDRA